MGTQSKLDQVRKRRMVEMEELQRVLRRSNREDELKNHNNKWPSVDNYVRLAKAVESKAPQVQFDDGFVYNIRYEEKSVFIRRDKGDLIPCGYIEYYRLKDFLAQHEE